MMQSTGPLCGGILPNFINLDLPSSSDTREYAGLNEFFRLPRITALFWGPWSSWPDCPGPNDCIHNQPVPATEVSRTRVCQRQLFYRTRGSRPAWISGGSGESEQDNAVPCSQEHFFEIESRSCPPVTNCVRVTKTAITFMNNSEPATHHIQDFHSEKTLNSGFNKKAVEGHWGPWKTVQLCRPLVLEIDRLEPGYAWESLLRTKGTPVGMRCEPGIEVQSRRCHSSVPRLGIGPCLPEGKALSTSIPAERRKIHCWINEACSHEKQTLEPPANCAFRAILNEPLIQLQWYRTPYGVLPTGYQVQVLPLNCTDRPYCQPSSQKVDMGITDPWGEGYTINVTGVQQGHMYEVSVGSTVAHGLVSSSSCKAVINVGAGDGVWSSWSEWSRCSSKCASVPGTRKRQRTCSTPPPTNGGRKCSGLNYMTVQCFGESIAC
ncbi:unnamed protein product [Calicophoron daubneyi]|uniref:Ig-like domain-containing protein n=1 Tax=Calicophoron daubneyi TaxID=300641 RepID=A0AAV2TNN1_CALDB